MSGTLVAALLATSCSKDDNGGDNTNPDDNRWMTISGAIDQPGNDDPHDGNEGTMVYAISVEDAKNPEVSVNVFDQGIRVKSQRTARLQASVDGKFLYNIQYVGEDGGIFNKYSVQGGNNFVQDPIEVDTEPYVSASPRWLKVSEGVGIAVRGTAYPDEYEGTSPNFTFKSKTTKIDVLSLDLNDPKIIKTASFDQALSTEEVAAGYYIWRIDVPVLNRAQNKVYIGVGVRKVNTTSFTIGTDGTPTFATDNTSPKSLAKTIVLDYPSFANPKVITSTQTRGNTNGYRSTMQYVGTDGNVYQATSGEGVGNGGSKILRINSSGDDYDNNYVFSLDQALGVQDSYIETWKYAGDGIGFVVYSIVNNAGERTGGHIARIDLNAKTATKYDIPNESALSFGQIQNIGIEGDEVFIAVAVPGQDGNIYVFNSKTGEMKKGAKLINKPGNQYIGVY
ncbi:MAG TPA: hypothetical protein VKZ57_09365 [Sphingobacterium sp.]|nr:hypothetical protein [Sphingobacterium sp.]